MIYIYIYIYIYVCVSYMGAHIHIHSTSSETGEIYSVEFESRDAGTNLPTSQPSF